MARRINLTLVTISLLSTSLFAFAQGSNIDVSERLENFTREANATSVSVALVRNGNVLYMGTFGKANVEEDIDATTEHRYMIGSTSKLFTSTAIMQLVEQGKVKLEADVNDYLPFEIRNPNYPDVSITVEMLLRHESSIANMREYQNEFYVDGDSEIGLKEFCQLIFDPKGEYYKNSNFEEYRPGSKWNYRNWNYVLLGYIVERVTVMQYYEYSYENILKPLEMNTSKWFLKEFDSRDLAYHYKILEDGKHERIEYYGWPGYPDGQLRANVEEMANFIIMMLDGGQFNKKQILSRDSISQMFTCKEYEGLTGEQYRGMGLTWFVNASPNKVFSHGGGPAGSHIDLIVDQTSNSGLVMYVTGVDVKTWDTWEQILDIQSFLQQYAAGNAE